MRQTLFALVVTALAPAAQAEQPDVINRLDAEPGEIAVEVTS